MSRRARLIRHERTQAVQLMSKNDVLSKSDENSKQETPTKIEVEVEVEVEIEPNPKAPEKPEEPTVSEILDEVQSDGVVTDEEEDQLRQLAKSKGISHWWSKSVERIQDELAEIKE